jgi:predicted house-cleaning NTP pyrophosphatase (Maf/HAM1 superfamily)
MRLLFPAALPQQVELLKRLNLECRAVKTAIYHETLHDESLVRDLHQRVQARIRVASETEVSGFMLATESAVLYRKAVFECPRYKMDALEVLKQLSRRSHLVVTAWCLKNLKTGKTHSGSCDTKVIFRDLPDVDLTNYVNDHSVIHYLAGYDPLHTQAISFIDKIQGSVTNFLYHLPLEQLLPVFKQERIM